jgi:hypothetical protein
VIGALLLLLGLLGFTPGITEHFDDLKFAGDRPSARIFGVFQISGLHNLAHLLSGAVALALARTAAGARTYLIGGGAFYLAFWLVGFVNHAYWIPSNNADDWLHLALGVLMIAVGVSSAARRKWRGVEPERRIPEGGRE